MSKRLKRILQYILFLAIACFFLWLVSRKVSFADIFNKFREAHLWPILLIFIVGIGSHYIRALRWKMLIRSMGYKVGSINTMLAIMIGYLVNLGTPRMGEVARCAVLAKYEKVPADKLAGTMIVERLIDLICLILLLILTYITQFRYVNEFVQTNLISPLGKKLSPTILTIGILLIFILLFATVWFRKRLLNSENKLVAIVRNLMTGFLSIKTIKPKGTFILYTGLIWLLYWGMTYIGFYAFDELSTQGGGTALSVLSLGSIGFVVPAPGGLGSYQYFVTETLTSIYHIPTTVANTFAHLSWAAQTLILIIGGFASMILLPIYNTGKTEM